MIKGLKVTVAAAELREICLKQAEYHDQRRATYAENMKNLVNAEIEGMNYSSGDPKKTLREKETWHADCAAELRFIADHLDPGEAYRLDGADLVKLGIMRQSYRY